jgi:hypothetical protein
MKGFPERWIIKLPRCLPAEKFPTFASGRQGRGPATLLSSRYLFPKPSRLMSLEEGSPATGMDLRHKFIGLTFQSEKQGQLSIATGRIVREAASFQRLCVRVSTSSAGRVRAHFATRIG